MRTEAALHSLLRQCLSLAALVMFCMSCKAGQFQRVGRRASDLPTNNTSSFSSTKLRTIFSARFSLAEPGGPEISMTEPRRIPPSKIASSERQKVEYLLVALPTMIAADCVNDGARGACDAEQILCVSCKGIPSSSKTDDRCKGWIIHPTVRDTPEDSFSGDTFKISFTDVYPCFTRADNVDEGIPGLKEDNGLSSMMWLFFEVNKPTRIFVSKGATMFATDSIRNRR